MISPYLHCFVAVVFQLVSEFAKEGGLGEELQRHLQLRAKKRLNWVSFYSRDSQMPVCLNMPNSVCFACDYDNFTQLRMFKKTKTKKRTWTRITLKKAGLLVYSSVYGPTK